MRQQLRVSGAFRGALTKRQLKPVAKKTSGGLVDAVAAGSPAAAADVRPGDLVTSLNGHPLRDVIDYQFHLETGPNQVSVDRGGSRLTLSVDTAAGEDPGISFSSVIFDRIRSCRCDCIFCFIDQLPRGLRKSLYLKDDDFRLSFLYGNFITLGNLTDDDLERIFQQRLSPLHVSVHATDPEVRARLMGLSPEEATRGLATLRRLGEGGIETNIQVVLCPGINDGHVLEQTVNELAEDYPLVRSVGVVPVAVDPEFLMHHAGLSEPGEESTVALRPVAASDCETVIEAVDGWQEDFRHTRGNGFVYAGDEFYLRSGHALPPYGSYDDFPQYENGIGIATSFIAEAVEKMTALLEQGAGPVQPQAAGTAEPSAAGTVFLLTGTIAAGVMYDVCDMLGDELGIDFRPLIAENRTFGPHVTVTGLLGGRDILSAAVAANLDHGDVLLIPDSCLDGGAGPRFLDGVTLEALRRDLPCPVLVSPR